MSEIITPAQLIARASAKLLKRKEKLTEGINRKLSESTATRADPNISFYLAEATRKDEQLIEQLLSEAGYVNIVITFQSDGRNGTDVHVLAAVPPTSPFVYSQRG